MAKPPSDDTPPTAEDPRNFEALSDFDYEIIGGTVRIPIPLTTDRRKVRRIAQVLRQLGDEFVELADRTDLSARLTLFEARMAAIRARTELEGKTTWAKILHEEDRAARQRRKRAADRLATPAIAERRPPNLR